LIGFVTHRLVMPIVKFAQAADIGKGEAVGMNGIGVTGTTCRFSTMALIVFFTETHRSLDRNFPPNVPRAASVDYRRNADGAETAE
jgi:hypothetical protein